MSFKLIGVTGGIGAGKSLICKVFETMGFPVYYADDRAKKIMINDKEVVSQVKTSFGKESYLKDGSINKTYLAERVFGDKEKLLKINAIVHPVLKNDFQKWILENKNKKLLFKEAALLFENESYKDLDYTILVIAEKELRIKRVLERDFHRNRNNVLAIMEKQLTDEKKIKLADKVINNNGNYPILCELCIFISRLLIDKSKKSHYL